jgi:thiol-disulfide isomerase/thioredoxin
VGDDVGAFQHLLRALAMGTEDKEDVEGLARHLYEKLHVVPGGLETLVEELRRQLSAEVDWAESLFGELDPTLDEGGGVADPRDRGGPVPQPHARTRVNHPLVGSPAPDFTFTTLDGETVSRDSLRGHLVVVDFWATWCAPCVEAMPMMDALSRTFAREGVVFVALSMDDGIAEVRRMWVDSDSPIRVGMAPEGVSNAFFVEGIPATFVIDADGKIADFHGGYDSNTGEALTMTLIRLLAEAR